MTTEAQRHRDCTEKTKQKCRGNGYPSCPSRCNLCDSVPLWSFSDSNRTTAHLSCKSVPDAIISTLHLNRTRDGPRSFAMSIPLPFGLFAALGSLPAELVVALAALAVAASVGGGVGFWRVYGKGPRRNRTYKQTRESLHQGNWQAAKARLVELRNLGPASAEWAGRITNLEGECLRAAGDAALAERYFEEALEHHLAAAKLLGTGASEAQAPPLNGMLPGL